MEGMNQFYDKVVVVDVREETPMEDQQVGWIAAIASGLAK
jgi:hypothetical protein